MGISDYIEQFCNSSSLPFSAALCQAVLSLISLKKRKFLFKSSGFSTFLAHSQILCNNSKLPFSSAIYQAGLPYLFSV